MKSKTGIFLVGTVLVAALGWGGYQGLDRRYDALTKAAEAALDHGNVPAAARLAAAATQGREWPVPVFDNSRAEGLLLEALMAKQAVVEQTAVRALPKFFAVSDVFPIHTGMSPDGARVMVLHNEQRDEPTYDIYEPASARRLVQLPMFHRSERTPSYITEFSRDLSTAIVWREDRVSFRDTLTGKPVLDTFKTPDDFNGWVISCDRKRVSASNDKVFRIWDLSADPVRFQDYPLPQYGGGDDFEIAPDNMTLVARQGSNIDGTSRRVVLDLRTNTIRLTMKGGGSIGAAFSQDGRYLVTSTTGNGSSQYGVQVWDTTTYKAVGRQFQMPEVQGVATLFDGRILALVTTFEGVRFLDRATMRFIGGTADMPRDFYALPGWSGKTAYSLDSGHTLHTYAVNPLMATSGKALVAQACTRWGAKGRMTLTPAEIRTAHAVAAFDPCGG